jgi:hypothetical protein
MMALATRNVIFLLHHPNEFVRISQMAQSAWCRTPARLAGSAVCGRITLVRKMVEYTEDSDGRIVPQLK